MHPRSHILRAAGAGLAVAALLILAATALGQTARQTTGQGTLALGGPLDAARPAFRGVVPAPADPRYVRNLSGAYSQHGRSTRRTSLAYFGYLTDFQLADEESPARAETLAPASINTSFWRSQEALVPQTIDAAMRRMNAFAPASPNAGAKGVRAPMMMALLGGDQTDNQQQNEAIWTRQLIEGGQTLVPNSGVPDYSTCTPQQRAELAKRPADEARRYTGVQDANDYPNGSFWDPDSPSGAYVQWPTYAGLMDAAQQPFVPVGLRNGTTPLPTYLTVGNHDAEVQGYAAATTSINALATGCFKPTLADPVPLTPPAAVFASKTGFAVPPDPRRAFAGPAEMKRIFSQGSQADAHGYGLVDPAQNTASAGSAAYYAWSPRPNLRFISLDTSSEGTAAKGGPEGNIDNPQFQWLRGELRRAKAARQFVVVFGHHPIRRLIAATPDEDAGACPAGSDLGCDTDPRNSSPIHLRASLERLFNANANVVAYLSGHSHVNRIRPCATRCVRGKGNWWSVETTSATDFPQQDRLVELMDNKDGTVSVIATPVDQAGGATAPPPTADPAVTAGYSIEQFASLSRMLAANDPRGYLNANGGRGDRNVELIARNPFAGKGAGTCAGAVPATIGGRSVDNAVLGRSRTSVRKTVAPKALRAKSTRVDRWCVVGGGNLRVGYSRSRRAVLALSTAKANRVARLKIGSRTRTVTARLRGERRVRLGSSTFYLGRASRARIVVQVRRGKVVQLGLADRRLTATAKGAKGLLGTFF